MSAPGPSDAAIYARMIAAIRDQRLPPGTKLVEDRLAEAFGVSRTRIRPVLVRLAHEQVVDLAPNRGATVARPTAQEAREVFEVRRLVEPTLVQRFVDVAAEADLAALARNIADEEAARAGGETARAIRLAGEFHLQLAQAAGQDTLTRILGELISRTSLVLLCHGGPQAHEGCSCRAHRGLLAALRQRDAGRATRLMRTHLTQLERQLHIDAATTDELPDLRALFQGGADAPAARSTPNSAKQPA